MIKPYPKIHKLPISTQRGAPADGNVELEDNVLSKGRGGAVSDATSARGLLSGADSHLVCFENIQTV